jgi:hypothetical protein
MDAGDVRSSAAVAACPSASSQRSRSRITTERPEPTGRGGFKIQAESKFQNFFEGPDEGRLPKSLIACIDPPGWGHVAEWLRSGLQNRLHQFNSGRGLHQSNQQLKTES